MLSVHKQLQKTIQGQLPAGECFIEHPFGERIADLFWKPQKIVFEIQYSPISLEEALKRSCDYKELGVDLVWILHQRTFNKRRAGGAEIYLRSHLPCYYSNMTPSGQGIIYDQWEVWKGRTRQFRSSPLPIDLTLPRRRSKKEDALERISFKGDLFHAAPSAHLGVQLRKKRAAESSFKRILNKIVASYQRQLAKALRGISDH